MKNLLKKFSEHYYNGDPLITNEQYDALEKVYGQSISGAGEVSHMFPMYSLQKVYPDDKEPFTASHTPKLDGAAVSLLYLGGKLTLALTRGDGKKGRDITNKMELLVPSQIKTQLEVLQVTGEVTAVSTVENSRNYASGALNLKNLDTFKDRVSEGEMVFVAYNAQVEPNIWGLEETYTEDMLELRRYGFKDIIGFDSSKYPTDGLVCRMENNDKFNSLGFTAKFPRGAYALKENDEGVVTTLLDVIWQTGKSGKVTPVAILEPVKVGEAMVARATLNNIAFIAALDLELGCKVTVVRSGEIIPCIINRVYE